MWQPGRTEIYRSQDDGAAATASGDGAAGPAGGSGSGGAAATPWHGGAIDADTLGFFQIKGLDATDPVKLVKGMTEQYRNAESLRGVPANELIRKPRPNAAETDIKAFWSAVGVPAEAKDYDLSQIKFADGSELEPSFADTMRSLLHNGRVPKDRAADIVNGLVKYMEASDTAEAAQKTAYVKSQEAELKKNWGSAYAANGIIAKSALVKLGMKAGLTEEQTDRAWNALSEVGGVDAALAVEMLRVAGMAMGEHRYISGQIGAGDPALLTREAAKQEIDALKNDAQFRARVLNGDVESKRKWSDLHKVAFGPAAA